jgi:ComF family protein
MAFIFQKIIDSILFTLYPNTCCVCNKTLYSHKDYLCIPCENSLPYTNHQIESDNEVKNVFRGRIQVEFAGAMLLFTKKGVAQKILHDIKYNGRKDMGIYFGKLLGEWLKPIHENQHFDLIIPLPIHKKKQINRGYNQSELLANETSKALQIPLFSSIITKRVNNQSQTKKSRINRWKNVESVFLLKNPETLHHKHILIIDDTITTGATLESIMQEIRAKSPSSKISIATLASSINF